MGPLSENAPPFRLDSCRSRREGSDTQGLPVQPPSVPPLLSAGRTGRGLTERTVGPDPQTKTKEKKGNTKVSGLKGRSPRGPGGTSHWGVLRMCKRVSGNTRVEKMGGGEERVKFFLFFLFLFSPFLGAPPDPSRTRLEGRPA